MNLMGFKGDIVEIMGDYSKISMDVCRGWSMISDICFNHIIGMIGWDDKHFSVIG